MCLNKSLNSNRHFYYDNDKIIGMKNFNIKDGRLYGQYINYQYEFYLEKNRITTIINNQLQKVNYNIGYDVYITYREMGYHITSFSPFRWLFIFSKDFCYIPVYFKSSDIQDMDGLDVVVQQFSFMSPKDFDLFLKDYDLRMQNEEKEKKLKEIYNKEYRKIYRAIKKEVQNAELKSK